MYRQSKHQNSKMKKYYRDEMSASNSIFIKGPKEVFQVEFSKLFALRYVVHFIRNIQRLLWRSACLRIFVLFIFAIVVIAYALFSRQDQFKDSNWIASETCVADSCRIKHPLLMAELSPNLFLILIHSSIGGKSRRDAIRNTWVSQLTNEDNSPIQYRFILGSDDVDIKLLKNIQKESEKYGDMIVLPHVKDSFYDLTRRTIESFKYVKNHMSKFSYIMKCDDDSMVDVARIASELQLREKKGRLFWGYLVGKSDLVLWPYNRYYEKKWFICNKYLTYAHGGGYLLSEDLMELIVQNTQFNTVYTNEDVAVGAWLAPYNFEYKHDSRFNTRSTSRGCKDPFLVLHKVSISDMLYYHESYIQLNRYCSWRTYWHAEYGYVYNWNVPSSGCCLTNAEVP